MSQPMPATSERHSARELAEVDVDWLIAERPAEAKTLEPASAQRTKRPSTSEYMKASIRAGVEHPFRIIKRQFGSLKARYKGLLKNDNQLAMLFTGNLFQVDQMIRQWEISA